MTEQEKAFYDKKFYFSYSSLNKLLYDPKLFYSYYILNEKEEKTDAHLIEGRVLHCLLLQPEEFDNQFVVMPSSIPTANTKNIIDNLYKTRGESTDLNDYKDEILAFLQMANLHQSLKTDQQRVEKIITDESITYWNYLISSQGKTVIDSEVYDRLVEAKEEIIKQERFKNLFSDVHAQESGLITANEMLLSYDLKNYQFGIKGIIDRLIVDPGKREVHIIDLKTTGKTHANFLESIEFYQYWLQATIYTLLAVQYIADNKLISEEKLNQGVKVYFKFVVYDKLKNTCIFEVSESTLDEWYGRMEKALSIANYHYSNNKYQAPQEFDSGIVVI
jgi:hypothetical protein